MVSDCDWEDNSTSGVTPGPEEALQKEIEKCKLLKIERLQLRDEIENLKGKYQHLLRENKALQKKLKTVVTKKITRSPSGQPLEKMDYYKSYATTLIRISSFLLFLMMAWLFYFLLTL